MAAELLDDKKISNTKPTDKPNTLRDGNGLFVLIHPNSQKYFQLRTTVNGKLKLIQIGVYGEVLLSDAREIAREKRKLANTGIASILQKKIEKASSRLAANSTLETVYVSWLSENPL